MSCFDKIAAEAKTWTTPCVIGHPSRQIIRAFRAWIDYRQIRGQTADVDDFTLPVAEVWASLCSFINNEVKRKKIDPTTTVEKFKGMDEWENFSLEFHSILSHHRSTKAFAPLNYVLRDEAMVDPQDLLKAYLLIDEDLIATASHANQSFGDDNRTVYDLFSKYFRTTPYHQYIQPFHLAKNGRAAYIAIRDQALGLSVVETRGNQATSVLLNTHFTGDNRFMYDQYVAKHMKAHNDLVLSDKPLTKARKVQ